jgi:acyl-CoA thioester hydrolase
MRYHETKITVRFNEVDSYRVAWHGHYVAWMEIGRSALAGQFGLDAGQLEELGYLGPVVSLEVKYLRPARFKDILTVCTRLRRSETAILIFENTIIDSTGTKLASGVATHALTDLRGVLQYQLPESLSERVAEMKAWLEA